MNLLLKMMQTAVKIGFECEWLLLCRLGMLCSVGHTKNKRLHDHKGKRQLKYRRPCKCDKEELPEVDLIVPWPTK